MVTKPGQLSRLELATKVGKMISSDRNETHGDPHMQFITAQKLKKVIAYGLEVSRQALMKQHREALDMINTKQSRIVHGDADDLDHWLDIAGYALIAAEACNQKETEDENSSTLRPDPDTPTRSM